MPAHFYKEREHTTKALEVHRTRSLLFYFDLCSSNKDLIFLCERFHRPFLQGLQGEKPQNSNLIMVFLCMGLY